MSAASYMRGAASASLAACGGSATPAPEPTLAPNDPSLTMSAPARPAPSLSSSWVADVYVRVDGTGTPAFGPPGHERMDLDGSAVLSRREDVASVPSSDLWEGSVQGSMRIDAGARDQCYGARRMSDHEGKVSIRGKDTDKVTIVVTDAGGKEHLYPLEPRALIAPGIEDGTKKHVKPGELLADEKNRRYRLVKIEFDDGRPIDMREEVRNVNGQWVQRGSESTRFGASQN